MSGAVRVMTRTSFFRRPLSICRPASERGFTLLEVLLVLSIIALASVLVVPNFGSLDARAYSVQLRHVNSLMRYARRNAVITGRPVSARLYASSHGSDHSRLAPAGRLARVQEQRAGSLQAPQPSWESDGISLSFEDSTERLIEVERFVDVTFYPEGGSSGGTLIFSRDDRHTRVVIDPFTGRIRNEEANAPI